MGNSLAKSIDNNQNIQQKGGGNLDKKIASLEDGSVLDIIVAKYILSMNMSSLSDLRKTNKCDEIKSLTIEAFNKTATIADILAKYNIMYGKNEKEYTPNMCNDVVDVYINISKIYSAIVSNVNPVYEYQDEKGDIVSHNMVTEKEVDVFGEELALSKLSFCGAKIQSLTGNGDVCEEGKNNLEHYLDVPELHDMYCDADYDTSTGTFLGMTDKTQEEYMSDLEKFYKVFTGKSKMPDTIKRFGDIPLTDFDKSPVCKYRNFNSDECYDELCKNKQSSSSSPSTKVSLDAKERLLNTYAVNLRNMVSNVNIRQSRLITILNEIFMFDTTLDGEVRVNNEITANRIKELIKVTRELVNQINLSCSIDYMNGIRVYEAIVEIKALDTSIKQIEYIQKLQEIIRNPASV